MQLKIASITNLTDARFFSAVGAHYLGFNFDVLNENNISISQAKEIIQWLHEPVIVGEFGIHQTKEEIEFMAQQMELNEIQISFEHPQKNDLAFEKFLYLEDISLFNHQSSADFFVVRLHVDELKDDIVKQFILNNKVFLETDFNKNNIQQITETLQPYGIQITCRKEEKAGFSIVDEYAELLEIIGFS